MCTVWNCRVGFLLLVVHRPRTQGSIYAAPSYIHQRCQLLSASSTASFAAPKRRPTVVLFSAVLPSLSLFFAGSSSCSCFVTYADEIDRNFAAPFAPLRPSIARLDMCSFHSVGLTRRAIGPVGRNSIHSSGTRGATRPRYLIGIDTSFLRKETMHKREVG